MIAWWFSGSLDGCGRPRFDVQVFASPLDLIIFQQLLKCMPRAGWVRFRLFACCSELDFPARLIVWAGFTRKRGVTRAEACGQVARVGTLRNLHYTAERQRLQSFGVLFGSRTGGAGLLWIASFCGLRAERRCALAGRH